MINNYDDTNNDEYIVIPNPIYDVVFKYLMEDIESATIVLSTLINEKITSLQLEPLTHAEKKEQLNPTAEIQDPTTEKDIRLFHLDFTATVELPDGSEELIMIELQKATEPGDIFRFKRYISKNFQRKHEKEILNQKSRVVETIITPIRLIPIFILNFRIEKEINDLLIKTNHKKIGVFRNKELEDNNGFIDNLIYDLWVVQLPNLHKIDASEYENDEYKSKLYSLLKLFDQKSTVRNNEHRLRLIRKFFPGFLDRVIKRLQSAAAENDNLEEQMHAEDEYLEALVKRDNKISHIEALLEKKEKELGKKEEELGKKDEELGKKDEELGKKDEELNKNNQIILNLAKTLKESGFSIKSIQEKTNLSASEIEKL